MRGMTPGLRLWPAIAGGAAVGVLLLHPLTMAIYWFEFHPGAPGVGAAWRFIADRISAGFAPRMLLMAGVFAAIGAGQGLLLALLAAATDGRRRLRDHLERELARGLGSIVAAGESDTIEFKASARWDYRLARVNRSLEEAVIRTIAGFLNHRGGSLLLGIDNDGEVLGLHNDYASLKRPDRDGYAQLLGGLVARRLGARLAGQVHLFFHSVDARDVCRVLVEPGLVPAYVRDDTGAHYYLRIGNATRELDVPDAVAHIAARWPRRGRG